MALAVEEGESLVRRQAQQAAGELLLGDVILCLHICSFFVCETWLCAFQGRYAGFEGCVFLLEGVNLLCRVERVLDAHLSGDGGGGDDAVSVLIGASYTASSMLQLLSANCISLRGMASAGMAVSSSAVEEAERKREVKVMGVASS